MSQLTMIIVASGEGDLYSEGSLKMLSSQAKRTNVITCGMQKVKKVWSTCGPPNLFVGFECMR